MTNENKHEASKLFRQLNWKGNGELDEEELIKRAKDYGRENLKISYSIIKVIGLTTATIVLLNIILSYQPFDFSKIENFSPMSLLNWHFGEHRIEHLTFDVTIICWVTSCVALILTYDAAMFATVFLYRIINESALLLIFSYVGFEFFIFAVLYPNFFVEKTIVEHINETGIKHNLFPHFISLWFIIYGTYTISIGFLAFDTVRRIGCTIFHTPKITDALKEHYSSDVIETFIVGSFNVCWGFVSFFLAPNTLTYVIIVLIGAVFAVVGIFIAFFNQYKKRQLITKYFLNKPPVMPRKEAIEFIKAYAQKMFRKKRK